VVSGAVKIREKEGEKILWSRRARVVRDLSHPLKDSLHGTKYGIRDYESTDSLCCFELEAVPFVIQNSV